MPEAPDADAGREHDQLDDRGREVDRDGRGRLLAHEERAHRALEHEEQREAHAEREAALAPSRDEHRDERVHEREHIGHDREVGDGPRRAARIHAVEDARGHEQDRGDQHEQHDRTQGPCHYRSPTTRPEW